jgi:succinate dehydrogenase/fumarate reductase flavoprotein subunit
VPEWSEEFDVVVCGFGGSGAAAAIEAHDSGCSVLVVEKSPEGGGSTAESGGSIPIIVDAEAAVDHYCRLTDGRTPKDVLENYVAEVAKLPEWIEANGGSLETLPMKFPPFPARYDGTAYPNIPGWEGIGPRRRLRESGVDHGGTSLWNFLRTNTERRGVDVRLATRVTNLQQADDRTVIGVEIDAPGEEARCVRARRGVVLCTGGFAYGPDLLREHVGVELPALGPPGRNSGDGLQMAVKAGASLWHMNGIAAGFGYKVPGVEAAWMCRMPSFGFMLVDQAGRRFLNEPTVEHHAAGTALVVRDFRTGGFTRIPSFVIFDEATRLSGKVATDEAGTNRTMFWSEDNQAEIDKGWIVKGDSIADLAARIGVPADALRKTVDDYNCASVAGGDEFDRTPDQMVPLVEPPYYAVEVKPSLFNTQGGPRRDAQARVLDIAGQPIPGLFSAGELGSIWVAVYPGAGNVPEAIAIGRLAGRNAAGRSAA